jgi:Yip1 domain
MSEPNTDFQAPPPPPFPEAPAPSEPALSTGETITSIFFEPGRVFESMRERPRFLIAGLICIAFYMAFSITFLQKVGYERVVREAVENGPRSDQMTPEQKEAAIRVQSSPIVKGITVAVGPIIIAVIFAAGAGLYLLGSMLMAKQISYKQALAVWAYSALPPTVLAMIINVILIFLKSPDEYDIVSASRRGLVKANLSFLADAKAAPILYTALGAVDVFAFYGLFLAALGLRKVGKMSSGSSWGIVLGIWILGVLIRITFAAIFGQGM